MSEPNTTTSLQSVEASLAALKTFLLAMKDEKTSIIDAGKQLAVALQEDDAAWETLNRLNDIILPNLDRAIGHAGTLVDYLSDYATRIIETYEKSRREG